MTLLLPPRSILAFSRLMLILKLMSAVSRAEKSRFGDGNNDAVQRAIRAQQRSRRRADRAAVGLVGLRTIRTGLC